jgi:hypothetical protein
MNVHTSAVRTAMSSVNAATPTSRIRRRVLAASIANVTQTFPIARSAIRTKPTGAT